MILLPHQKAVSHHRVSWSFRQGERSTFLKPAKLVRRGLALHEFDWLLLLGQSPLLQPFESISV